MSIQDQVKVLIDGYKQQFREETGLMLICYPDIRMGKLSLKELHSKSKEWFEIEPLDGTNKRDSTEVRHMMIHIAREMGYNDTEISRYAHIERSGIGYAMAKVREKLKHSRQFKTRYMEYVQYLMGYDKVTMETIEV